MSLRNRSRNILIAEIILTLDGQFHQTLQMLNHNGIPDNCVLWINPCNGIYTVGMKYPVDIAFLDKYGRIVRMLKDFPPGCFADSTPATISAIELPNGRLSETETGLGDLMELTVD
jgi:hypothetical protein